jgi:hypothetical protein
MRIRETSSQFIPSFVKVLQMRQLVDINEVRNLRKLFYNPACTIFETLDICCRDEDKGWYSRAFLSKL